jgi:DNA-binding IclR family transcriptional regulator
MKNTPYPGTQAVLRALHLLKAFTDDRPVLNLGELAQAIDLKKTTAFRLLTALEREGFVMRAQNPDGYRLGPEILALAGRALRSSDLRQAARESLELLASQSGETATLEIRVDDQVLVLDEVPGNHLLGTLSWLGARWPMYATSTGKVILANLSEAERAAMLIYPLLGLTEHTIIRADAMAAELELIRQQGYALAVEEMEPGFAAVAAPIFRVDGAVLGAISLGGPILRLTSEVLSRLAGLVVEQAQAISRRLGYQPSHEE